MLCVIVGRTVFNFAETEENLPSLLAFTIKTSNNTTSFRLFVVFENVSCSSLGSLFAMCSK